MPLRADGLQLSVTEETFNAKQNARRPQQQPPNTGPLPHLNQDKR